MIALINVYGSLEDKMGSHGNRRRGANISLDDPLYSSKPSDCTYDGTLAPGSETRLLVTGDKACGACLPSVNSSDPAAWDTSLSGFQCVASMGHFFTLFSVNRSLLHCAISKLHDKLECSIL
jgi:hypothetical protein